jgi:uncharacterized protein YndB with AHSA1/START domain
MAVGVDTQMEAEREVVVSRIIEGPRNVVFDAFTDATTLGKWWVARNGSSITTHTFEFRPGGVWDATIHAGGSNFPNYIVWKEIAPPERIVWLYYGAGKADPNPVKTTLTLADRGATTEATLRLVFGSKEMRDEMVTKYHAAAGARLALDSLAEYVAASR